MKCIYCHKEVMPRIAESGNLKCPYCGKSFSFVISSYTNPANRGKMDCPRIEEVEEYIKTLINLLGLPKEDFQTAELILDAYLEIRASDIFGCEEYPICKPCSYFNLVHRDKGLLFSPERGFIEALVYITSLIREHPRTLNDVIETSRKNIDGRESLYNYGVQGMYHVLVEELEIGTPEFDLAILVPRIVTCLVKNIPSLNEEDAKQIERKSRCYLNLYDQERRSLESGVILAASAVYVAVLELGLDISSAGVAQAAKIEDSWTSSTDYGNFVNSILSAVPPSSRLRVLVGNRPVNGIKEWLDLSNILVSRGYTEDALRGIVESMKANPDLAEQGETRHLLEEISKAEAKRFGRSTEAKRLPKSDEQWRRSLSYRVQCPVCRKLVRVRFPEKWNESSENQIARYTVPHKDHEFLVQLDQIGNMSVVSESDF